MRRSDGCIKVNERAKLLRVAFRRMALSAKLASEQMLSASKAMRTIQTHEIRLVPRPDDSAIHGSKLVQPYYRKFEKRPRNA